MKGILKIQWKRGGGNEKLEVAGKRGRGTEVTERRDKYGVHLVREGRRYEEAAEETRTGWLSLD